jgi:ArsR family metal-binding transcriptional regulator
MNKAFLQITNKVPAADRAKAGAVVVRELKPCLSAPPEIRVYERL